MRAQWLTSTSYRLQTLLSFFGMIVSLIPLYFVAQALQPLMADSITDEGDQYFGFIVVGMMVMYLLNSAVRTLPAAVRSGINHGTLEALLSTPAGLPAILSGMLGVDLLWASLRVFVLLIGGWTLGIQVAWEGLLPMLVIMVLLILAYLPFGLVGAALVLLFRTPGPVPAMVISLSILLGGVYYPTHVIPSWIQDISDVIPLTYGLHALRQVLLEGVTLSLVASDIGVLFIFVFLFFTVGVLTFATAFRYARRSGTLTQY
ncbi:MAG: ABC transporter permease [Candidatus Competibacteraceae bacterium]